MRLEVMGWAPTEALALAFLESAGIAKLVEATAEQPEFVQPLTDVHYDPIGKFMETPGTYDRDGVETVAPVWVDGFHFNLWFYGDMAARLVSGKAQVDAEGNLLGLFERTHLNRVISDDSGVVMTTKARTRGLTRGDEVPSGEETATGVRFMDPASVKRRTRVWA